MHHLFLIKVLIAEPGPIPFAMGMHGVCSIPALEGAMGRLVLINDDKVLIVEHTP